MKALRTVWLILLILSLTIAGISCSYLKSSKPILPMRDQEKLLAGPLEANYIGNDKCLKACHVHDEFAENLRESLHGQQTEDKTGMPLVNCETCHGPGSLAVQDAVAKEKCDVSQLVVTTELPSSARNLLCLRCHTTYSLTGMQFWSTSHHAQAEVSCPDCHQLHGGRGQKMKGGAITDLCLECHGEKKMEMSFVSRHPVKEGKMTCTTCHNPHGSMNEKGLVGFDEQDLCLNCHGEKVGPFLYEHGGMDDGCTTCHTPHGSPFADMLRYQPPFLCLDCHSGHTDHDNPEAPTALWKQGFYTRCTNCHSLIHGTDTTVSPRRNGGGFTE